MHHLHRHRQTTQISPRKLAYIPTGGATLGRQRARLHKLVVASKVVVSEGCNAQTIPSEGMCGAGCSETVPDVPTQFCWGRPAVLSRGTHTASAGR